ncbi:MAG: hypothetical protein M1821_007111 [Bathelium mastoideum]|nr:MAG: hypothetical protein M1821_007111 [Bathelium mastoideum]
MQHGEGGGQQLKTSSRLIADSSFDSVFPEIAKIEKLWNHGKNRDPLCNQLSNKFRIPQFFWSRLGWDANGFFRPQANTVSGERIVRSYTSTFRFLLKQVKLTTKPGPVRSMTGTATLPDGGETLDYDWEYYGLHSVWTQLKGSQPGSNRYCQVLLCFDLVAEMRRRVLDAFEASDGNLTSASPFGVHNVFLEPLIEQYDTALWGFRIPSRINLDGQASKQLAMLEQRYTSMHELERHVVHAIETLKVASMTLETMTRDHKSYVASLVRQDVSKTIDVEENAEKSLRSFSNTLLCLHARAEAFEKRLQNEIRLAFDTVAADDHAALREQIDQQIKLSAAVETLKMQSSSLNTTVALLTLVFLPGSFISGFFGTNFFTISSNGNAPPQWKYVKEVWIFFVVTGPTTIIALAIWLYATRRERQWVFGTHHRAPW